MSWIDFLWPMTTGACITMALIHLWTGLRGSLKKANLLFSLSAIFAAAYSVYELSLIRATTVAEYLAGQ